jgi:arylsulfatase A-like enzyme
MRFLFFLVITTIGFGSCKETDKKTGQIPPNILFIMSDDHANAAVSSYGSKMIETPHIDRIGKEGVLFQNSFVTNSICAPSRAVLLTGKYSHLNGLRDNRDEFDGSQLTFPKLLQKTGYQTAMIGKWHLKTTPTGFDYWQILIGQGDYYNPVMIEMEDTIHHTGYTTNIITDIALDFLDKRDQSKPFCMLYHHKAPHRNWMPSPEHFSLYADEDLPLPKTFYDDYSTRSAAASEQDMRIEDMFLSSDLKLHEVFYGEETGTGGATGGFLDNRGTAWKNLYSRLTPEQKEQWDAHYDRINEEYKNANLEGKALLEWKYQRYIKDYLRCVKSVDDNIGRVLAYLDANNLTQNTIVVYTSDQGFYLGEHGWYDKRFMYEESLKMPLVIRYPNEIPATQINTDMVLNLDFAPTFLDFAGVNIPEDMQGASLRSVLNGKTPEDWRTSIYYHYYEYPHGWHKVKKHEGIRTKRYKLIHYYDDIDAWEFYDLNQDPNELNNLLDHSDYQNKIEDLQSKLQELREQYHLPENELSTSM